MRCSCKVCGTYMVQRERGVESGCVCPQCFTVCTACISPLGGKPLSAEDLKEAYAFGAFRQDMTAPLSSEDKEDASLSNSPMHPEEYVD